MSNNTLSNVREKMRQNSEDRRRDFEKYKERALQIRLIEMSSSSERRNRMIPKPIPIRVRNHIEADQFLQKEI